VKEKKVGVVLKSFDDVVSGLKEMLEPAKLAEFKKNVREQNNRAIFEIMEILERLLAGGSDSLMRSSATFTETVEVSSAD
jgi:1,2-diacylglycerol 3-beta-galactosyltransferase